MYKYFYLLCNTFAHVAQPHPAARCEAAASGSAATIMMMMCKLAVGRLISTLAQAQSQSQAQTVARNCATANCNWAGCGCCRLCTVCASCLMLLCQVASLSVCQLQPALLPGAGQMRLVMQSIQSQLQSKLLQLLNKISEFISGAEISASVDGSPFAPCSLDMPLTLLHIPFPFLLLPPAPEHATFIRCHLLLCSFSNCQLHLSLSLLLPCF